MSSTSIKANRQVDYFLNANFQDEINQLQETSAVADFTQTTYAIPRWATDQVGPGSDHNLLLDSGVILDDDNSISGVTSLDFVSQLTPALNGLSDVGGVLYFDGNPVAGGGSGDVVGPMASVDNEIPRFDGLTGKIIKGSGIVSNDLGQVSGIRTINGIGNTAVNGEFDLSLQSNAGMITLNSSFNTTKITGAGGDTAAILEVNNIRPNAGSDIAILAGSGNNIDIYPSPSGYLVLNSGLGIKTDNLINRQGSGPTITGGTTIDLVTTGFGSVRVNAGTTFQTDEITSVSNTALIIANPLQDIIMQPSAGKSVIINSGNGIICPAVYNVAPSITARNVTVDSSGLLTSVPIPYYMEKTFVSSATINTVSSGYIIPYGDTLLINPSDPLPVSSYVPFDMRIVGINMWVRTGGSWISSGTGFTIQPYVNGADFGSAATVIPTGANTVTFATLAGDNSLLTTTDYFTVKYTQTTTMMNVTSVGWTFTFTRV